MHRICVALLLLSMWSVYGVEWVPDCQRPGRPTIPDGDSTTASELLAARTTLEHYLVNADRYLKCLRQYEESLGDRVAEIDGHELLVNYNAMVDEMYLVGDEFNISLRKFKSGVAPGGASTTAQ